MKKKLKNIWITGPNGMVGSSLIRNLKKKYKILSVSKKKLNLLDQKKVFNFIKKKKTRYNHNVGS